MQSDEGRMEIDWQQDERYRTIPKLIRLVVWGFVVVVASLVWIVPLDRPPLWTDEWYSVFYSTTFDGVFADSLHPPLYYLILFLWRRLPWSDPLVAGRALSVLLSGITILLWAWVLRYALPGASLVRQLTIFFLLLSPYMLLYGRMIRYFSLAAALVALAIAAFWRWHRTGLVSWAVVAALGQLVLAFVDVTSFAITVVAETAFLYGESVRAGASRRMPLPWFAVGVMTFTLMNLVSQTRFPLVLPTSLRSALLHGMVGAGFPLWSVVFTPTVSPARWPLFLITSGAFLIAVTVLIRYRAEAPRFLRFAGIMIFVALTALGVLAVFSRPRHIWLQTPKLFLPFVPLVYITIAYAVTKLPNTCSKGLLLISLWLTSFVGLYNYKTGQEFIYPSYDLPWDEAARIVVEHEASDDIVMVPYGPFVYYYHRFGGKSILLERLPPAHLLKSPVRIWTVDEGISLMGPDSDTLLNGGYREHITYKLGTLDPTLRYIGSMLVGYPAKDYLLRVSLHVSSQGERQDR